MWCYGMGHERKGTWLEEGVGAIAENTMLDWREIEKIPAKLGRATDGILGRAYGVCP